MTPDKSANWSKNPVSFIISAAFILVLATLAPSVAAQQLTARPDRGHGGNGGYQTTEIDSVSLQNGGVSLQIPLASLPPMAGGKLGFTLSARYNSKLFDLHRREVRIPPTEPTCPTSHTTEELLASDSAGWKIGAQYDVFFRDANEDYDYIDPDNEPCYPNNEFFFMSGRFHKPMLRMPDGSEHELRIEGTFSTYQGQRDHLKGYFQYSGFPNQPVYTTPVRFYTFDGSYITIIYYPPSSPIKWIMYFKDGTRVEQSADGQRTIDTNGNSVLQGYDHVNNYAFARDEHSGREIRWSASTYNSQPATKVQYRSVGGAWQDVYVVWGTTTVKGKVYAKTGWNPNGGEFGQGATCFMQDYLPAAPLSVVREVVYPLTGHNAAPQKYAFEYNSDSTSQVTDNVKDSCLWAAPPTSYAREVSNGWGRSARSPPRRSR